MKLETIFSVGLFLSASLAEPVMQQKRAHYHRKRDAAITTLQTISQIVTDEVDVTVYVDEDETSTDAPATTEAPTTTVSPTSAASIATTSVAEDVQNKIVNPAATSAAAAAASLADSSTYTATSASSGSSSISTSSIDGDLKSQSTPSKFEDGTLSCDAVPTGNGVISLDWLQYNGWASILNEGGYASSTCKEGYYCSYACQAGMSKTQWPSSQPSSGVSIGGLVCKNGKLYRTNTNTDYLCEWDKPTANAVSKLDKVLALCRTDYPGSENMCVPTRLTKGQSKPISVVDSSTYYKWQGKSTSAQYYVNNAGVDVEKGCIWGTEGSGIGNWAPVNLGAGYTDGITYLSIIPNPNNKTPPNYSIKIEATSGSTISGSCTYINGKYNGDGTDGCTVGVTKGSANFVFY